jgi:phosphatidylinositol dimannoside acyltransferase
MKNFWQQTYEIWMFIVVPGIAALLPWSLGWRWLRWWAQRDGGPFDEAARAAISVVRTHLPIADERAFAEKIRLMWLIDYCDFMASVMHRRRSWLPWHVRVVGAWPKSGGFMAVGVHHSPCYFLFRSLAQANLDCMTIATNFDRSEYQKHPVRYWYGCLRFWDMSRVGRRPIAYRPGIKPMLNKALTEGAGVLGLVDLPPRLAPRGQRHVRFLDQDLSLPDGIVKVAQEAGVPVVPFWVEFDAEFYTRRFCIGEALDPNDVDGTLGALAKILDRQIRSAPEAWFFWPELPRWIEDAKHLAKSEVGAAEQMPDVEQTFVAEL